MQHILQEVIVDIEHEKVNQIISLMIRRTQFPKVSLTVHKAFNYTPKYRRSLYLHQELITIRHKIAQMAMQID